LRAQAASLESSLTVSSSPTVSSDFGNSIVNSAHASRQSSRQPTPVNSDNEDTDMSLDQWSAVKHGKKLAAKATPSFDHASLLANSQRCADLPRCSSAPGEEPPKKSQPAPPKRGQPASGPKDGAPASRTRADAGPSQKSPEATQKAPPRKEQSGQAGPRTKESTKRAELDACDPREAQGAVRVRAMEVPRKT
jgi:hypothetical protein